MTRSHLSVSLVLLLTSSLAAAFTSPNPFPQNTEQEASTEYTSDETFEEACLNVTNTYRRQHNATALGWNDTLADVSREWSERCVFEHSGGPYGENLASGYPNASASIIAWGHERVDYDFDEGEFATETGHFTQLVWKDTTQMGCGRTECNGRDDGGAPGWYVVCSYYPPGNVQGAFVENVQEEVPENEQPEGPNDPQVPSQDEDENGDEECPQGAVCGGARRTEGCVGALWVAVLVSVFVAGGWI